MPLTASRAKPAVPFGGSYRVIDFVLSNLLHSRVSQAMVLTQYEFDSLHKHIRHGWYSRFGTSEDKFIEYLSPTQRKDHREWYRDTADAVTHNIDRIKDLNPKKVFILGGDHIYLMDYRQQVAFHEEREAEMTVSAVKVPRETAARSYGVLEVDGKGRLIGFEEKPEEPKPLPDEPDFCLASMGNYLFNTQTLLEELATNMKKTYVPRDVVARDPLKYPRDRFSSYDFGYDVLPNMLNGSKRRVYVYDLSSNENPAVVRPGYWKDIGDLAAYYSTNMELLQDEPPIILNHHDWRVRTYDSYLQAHVARGGDNHTADCIIAGGVVLQGAHIERSILSTGLVVERDAHVYDSIVFGGRTVIGKGAKVRNAIIDKGVEVCPGATIGYDQELDDRTGLKVEGAITVVPKGRKIVRH